MLVGSASVTEGAEIVDVVDVVDFSDDELHAATPRTASIRIIERNSFMLASHRFRL